MNKSFSNKCLILDLDETCFHTYKYMSQLKDLNILNDPKYMDLRKRVYILNMKDINGNGDGTNHQLWGIMRPGLRSFLKFCLNYFNKVIVWSAGVKSYVEAAVEYIFRGLPKPFAVFSRRDCLNEGTNEYPMYTKPIYHLIEKNPYLSEYINMKNTYIIDDRVDYVKHNYTNGIIIPPYNPSLNIESMRSEDYALANIMKWLLQNKNTNDVKLTRKNDIFISGDDICDFISTADIYYFNPELAIIKDIKEYCNNQIVKSTVNNFVFNPIFSQITAP